MNKIISSFSVTFLEDDTEIVVESGFDKNDDGSLTGDETLDLTTMHMYKDSFPRGIPLSAGGKKINMDEKFFKELGDAIFEFSEKYLKRVSVEGEATLEINSLDTLIKEMQVAKRSIELTDKRIKDAKEKKEKADYMEVKEGWEHSAVKLIERAESYIESAGKDSVKESFSTYTKLKQGKEAHDGILEKIEIMKDILGELKH